jgi:hypothetical protein
LIANLVPVAQVGMARVLEDGGMEVVVGGDHGPDALVEQARQLQPDAIVLGSLRDVPRSLSVRFRTAAPGAKLILWPRDESEMQVFDPGSSAPRYIPAGASDALVQELHRGRPTQERE